MLKIFRYRKVIKRRGRPPTQSGSRYNKKRPPREVVVCKNILALASLETRILLVDHVNFAAATDNLSARLVLQRPKGLADLHRALLSSPRKAIERLHGYLGISPLICLHIGGKPAMTRGMMLSYQALKYQTLAISIPRPADPTLFFYTPQHSLGEKLRWHHGHTTQHY